MSDFPLIRDDSKTASRFALEAQLENMSDAPISLEQIQFHPKAPFRSTSLNWDLGKPDMTEIETPVLIPRDVIQVAFLIDEETNVEDKNQKEMKDGRIVLGQLSMEWRTTMGDTGILNTGWLMTKQR